jgi:O-Antigen ligase
VIQRVACIIVFLVLTAEYSHLFEGHWSTPWHHIADLLFAPIPGIRLLVLDGAILAILIVARWSKSAMTNRARPIDVAIWTSIGTIFAWAIYGALTHGSVLDMRLQLHAIVMLLVTSFMQIDVMRTPEHFRMLGKSILYAGLFRFAMMFIFYVTVLRTLPVHVSMVTDHGDTILFATCIAIVVANAIHERRRRATRRAVVITALMLWCIQVNNRRLAYVAVIGTIIVIYSLMTKEVRRRLNRYLLMASPLVAIYVAVGWANPVGVFKPIASIQSMKNTDDPSTQSRILENIGLVVTLQTNPIFGTGFGHEYIEISHTFAATAFPQYRFVPHNSALGIAAFTGALGFIGMWMVFPVTVYMAARAYAFARAPLEKTIAMVAACEVFIHINQMWGDIGINAPQGIVIMSGAIAAGSRLAVHTQAWPTGSRRKRPAIGDASGARAQAPDTPPRPQSLRLRPDRVASADVARRPWLDRGGQLAKDRELQCHLHLPWLDEAPIGQISQPGRDECE